MTGLKGLSLLVCLYVQGTARDELEKINSENQPPLKTRVTTEVVESSDLEEDAATSQWEGQENDEDSGLVGKPVSIFQLLGQ